MNDRFERQRDLVPQERLPSLSATIIGVGAVGRQVALQLAAIGVRRLQLVDFDRVEPTNVTTQGYLASDVGQLKVAATRRAVEAVDPAILVEPIADRFRPRQSVSDVLFCAVDSISARASIWRSVRHRYQFWVDARMLGEVMRILVAVGRDDGLCYDSTLFAQEQAQAGQCSSRSTIYAASITAGLMVHQFARWLRGLPVDVDLTLNLLAGDMVHGTHVAT
jgi:molybdopterin/thiamine biosynthesis adenylyltransferase